MSLWIDNTYRGKVGQPVYGYGNRTTSCPAFWWHHFWQYHPGHRGQAYTKGYDECHDRYSRQDLVVHVEAHRE